MRRPTENEPWFHQFLRSAAAFRVTRDRVERAYEDEHPVTTFDEYIRALGLPTAGSMRISLGIASNFPNVHRFPRFVDSFIDERQEVFDMPPRSHC